jgi:hypothetical protein
MFEQLFETYRKTSETWLQMQQDVFKNVMQQWLSATPGVSNAAGEMNRSYQKPWMDLSLEILNRHRQWLETTYGSAIKLFEQSTRMSDAKSSDEYRRGVEDLWRSWFDTVKNQTEAQLRDLQNLAGKSMEIVQNAQNQAAQNAQGQAREGQNAQA